ncbi:MAG: hypothetical protein WBI63_06275 [Coriobacteriia bacterium]
MPQLAFLQTIVVCAIVAFVVAILAMPVGARVSPRAGVYVLRGSLIGLVVAVVACVAWGASSGELATFEQTLGFDGALQMAVFFGILYVTFFNFAAKYLTDKAREIAREESADA